jgi:hypothetical protein
MLAVFMRHRDYRFAIVAAVVRMTIVAGFASGIYLSNPRALAHGRGIAGRSEVEMFKQGSGVLWRQWAPLQLRLVIGYGFIAHGPWSRQ